MKVSAVMVTFNADRLLEAVLKSLQWCDEIIIVDSNSTDRTLAIAADHHAKVFQRTFDNFSGQKQFSVDQARNDWVLVIDSDEVVTADLAREITNASDVDAVGINGAGLGTSGYEVPRVLYFLGKRIEHCGGIDFPLRLFNRQHGKFNGAKVHERVVVNGHVSKMTHFIEHYSYDSMVDYFKKFKRYTSLAAEELYHQGKRAPIHKIFTSFPATFIKLYFFKFGFLDGFTGFLWCFFSACSPVVKYFKLVKMSCWTHCR